ncbi:hypothetical protein ACWDSL_19865 [Streptomyces sp. NPDC000941]
MRARFRDAAEAHGDDADDYVFGANAAGFFRVAEAKTARGVG